MFVIIPYHVDVPMRSVPWMNRVIIGLTVVCYPLCTGRQDLTDLGQQLQLDGQSWIGYVGYVLVHGGIVHLLGNMLFLWVFGNAVCAKVGNLAYPFIYFGLGALAGLLSHLIDPEPTIGASGAINGIVGMYVVWYLLNAISCWYAYWLFFIATDAGAFEISSFWIVLLWLAFDIWGAIEGTGDVAYFAHLAGFAAGFGLAILLLMLKWVEMEEGERSLLRVLFGDPD
jgi:membrane associated rhomboid family serine protease